MNDWTEGETRWIALDAIGERYRRYRLPDTAAEAAMASSLGRYGQLSPLAVCLRQERPEVLDGFKRVAASRTLPAVTSIQARLVVVDDPQTNQFSVAHEPNARLVPMREIRPQRASKAIERP